MKRFFAALLSAGLLLALCACGTTEAEPPRPLPVPPPAEVPELARKQLDPYPVTTRTYEETFTDEDGTVLAMVELSLPQVEDLPQIDAYYQSVANDLIQLSRSALGEAQKRLDDARTGGWEFHPVGCYTDRLEASEAQDYRIENQDGQVLSVLRKVVFDWGQGAPEIRYFGETFDCASQGRMQLGDFFAVPEGTYLPRLEELVRDRLTASWQTPAQQESEEPAELELDPLNFAFEFQGRFTLIVGEQMAEVSLEEINDLLKDQWKVQ